MMSISSSEKKRVIPLDVKEDLISKLPDEVLGRILSVLPVEEAVRTSTLSKRWRDTWMLINNLDFGKKIEKGRNCLMFVDHVMSCVSNLGSFYMKVCEYVDSDRVISWVSKVVEKNVLDFTLEGLISPSCIFSCETLTNLKIDCILFEDVPVNCNLPNLKVLNMCIDNPPPELTENLFTSCPVLEDLAIDGCIGNAVSFNIWCPNLKRLKIEIHPFVWEGANCKIVINAPNLEYMELHNINSMGLVEYVLENVKSVVEATMGMAGAPGVLADELLKSLTNVKSLSLDYAYVIALDFTLPALPVFSNLKHLELTIDFYRHMEVIVHLLILFPNLEELVIHERSFERKTYVLCHPSIVPRCLSTCIKVVRLVGFDANEYKMDFMQYVLASAQVLKKLIVICVIRRSIIYGPWFCLIFSQCILDHYTCGQIIMYKIEKIKKN
ncbi:hypothetical protein ACJIZ3_023276 [Penstemon smallii]|uniref:F-box domain-containing protein n=1 Tax=Penstemon smallii TaxID=265156 RepID=A0ABD3TNS9_9LAMI